MEAATNAIIDGCPPQRAGIPREQTGKAISESRNGCGKKFKNTDDLFDDLGL